MIYCYMERDRKERPMDVNELVTLIGSLGFPIVACIFLFKFLTQTMKENTAALDKLSDTISDLKATMQHITTYIIERQEDK